MHNSFNTGFYLISKILFRIKRVFTFIKNCYWCQMTSSLTWFNGSTVLHNNHSMSARLMIQYDQHLKHTLRCTTKFVVRIETNKSKKKRIVENIYALIRYSGKSVKDLRRYLKKIVGFLGRNKKNANG